MTQAQLAHPWVRTLAAELCDLVKRRYPNAEFEPQQGDDGVYIYVYNDPPLDCEQLSDVVSERETWIAFEDEMTIMMLPAGVRKPRTRKGPVRSRSKAPQDPGLPAVDGAQALV